MLKKRRLSVERETTAPCSGEEGGEGGGERGSRERERERDREKGEGDRE